MNPWLDPLIKNAQHNHVFARALAGYMSQCLERGEMPAALAAYFAEALKRIALGESADSVLHLDGRHARARFKRDAEIAREVSKLNRSGLPLRDNSSRAGAYTVVAENLGLGVENVERIYKQMHWLLKAEALSMMESDERPGELEIPPQYEAEWRECRQQLDADMHIAFMQLVDVLKR